jgi:predicted transcriptional regulator
VAAKKRQTFGKMVRERERAEKRARKQEKKEAKKAAIEAGLVLDHETGEYVNPSEPGTEPEGAVTPPGDYRS